MDIRETIVQNVMIALEKFQILDEIKQIVQDTLIVQLNKYEVEDRCTEIVTSNNQTEQALKKFIITKQVEGLAKSTLRRYADENLKLIRSINKPLHEITTYDIRFYLTIKRQRDKLSNRTLDGMRRCYSSFFSWLTAEGIIGTNPCLALSQIKYRKTIKKPFSLVEMERLRRACKNIRDLALIEFLYSTGCRVSEVSHLDIWDIDFEKSECVVVGKGNKERIVYLSPVCSMYLQKYISDRKMQSDSLFIGRSGNRMTKAGIEATVKRIGNKANIENVHPHRFRRTLATNLLDRGMNIQDVATILGHSDLKTTQIYCFISQGNVKSAYQKYVA